MDTIARTLCGVTAAGCVIAALAAPARAADASAWSEDSHSAFRLLAGANTAGTAPLRAGIEIKLQPGWHTYWRYPGDSGVPPRFDFSGSENLAAAKVLYPAPHLLSDASGNSIVYENAVTFPVRVTPKQAGKPVTLRVKLDYAVCEKLCVPAEGKAALTLTSGASTQEAAIAAAEARVPKQATAAQAGLSVRRVTNAARPLIMIDLKAAGSGPVDIFVEGPTPEWALPIPKPAPGAPAGHRQFGFELDGLPPGVDPKGQFDLTFTIVEGARALEVATHLD